MRSFPMGWIAGSRDRLVAAAAFVLALGAVEARANHVFTLSGVTFSDGGTATGTLTTNDALNSLVSFDILTSPGINIGFEYTPATASSSSTALPSILVLNTPPALNNILELTFTNLSAAGAPITIGTNDSFEQTLNARRVVVSGQVVAAAVPEPSSLVMGGIATLAALESRRGDAEPDDPVNCRGHHVPAIRARSTPGRTIPAWNDCAKEPGKKLG